MELEILDRPMTPDDALMAVFWVEYPDVISITDAHEVCSVSFEGTLVSFPPRLSVFDATDSLPSLQVDADSDCPMFVYLRFHERSEPLEFGRRFTNRTNSVIRETAPLLHVPPWEPDVSQDLFHFTVVEMVTPLAHPHPHPNGANWLATRDFDYAGGPSLTRCFDALQQVIANYRLVTNLMIPTPARERLGPLLGAAFRKATPVAQPWATGLQSVLNAFATTHGAHARPANPPDLAQLMARQHVASVVGHPSRALRELQLDADVALERQGDYRASVMLNHAAGEVLLDSVLMCLMFEEEATVDQAVETLSMPLLRRVRSQYHPRLKGAWNPDASGVIKTWKEECVWRRNRVTHAGVTPTREEAESCVRAYRALRTFVVDRAAAALNRYPLTAGVMVGEKGFERRSVVTQRAQSALELAGGERGRQLLAWMFEVRGRRIT